jgi:hypothetical protein
MKRTLCLKTRRNRLPAPANNQETDEPEENLESGIKRIWCFELILNLGSRETASGASMRIKLLRDRRHQLRLLQILRFQSHVISIIRTTATHIGSVNLIAS